MLFLNLSPRLLGVLGVLIAVVVVTLVDLLLGASLAVLFALCAVLARSRASHTPRGLLPGQPDRRRDTRRPVPAVQPGTDAGSMATDP